MKKILKILLLCILMLSLSLSTVAYAGRAIKITINGKQLNLDVQPRMINNRTMVPFRAIFEALGAKVEWNSSTKTVTAKKGNLTVVSKIGNKKMTVNNKEKSLDVAPVIIDGRTLVPARFIAEAFACTVEWNNKTSTVIITDPSSKYINTYERSVVPEYNAVTGAETAVDIWGIPVAPVSFEQSNARFIRYFYVSTAEQVEMYKNYLLSTGWTLNGTKTGGDSRGKCELTGYSHLDSNGNVDAQVEISFFPNCGDVDLVCVLKLNK